MASTPTASLLVQKQGVADNAGTWGTNLNVGLDVLDAAIAGSAEITTTGGTTTLADSDYTADAAKSMVLDIAGTLVSNATIIVPLRNKIYAVRNGTSGSYTLTIKTSTGTGVDIPQSASAFVVVDATANDVDFLTSPAVGTSGSIGAATGVSLSLSSGTGLTVGSSTPFSDSAGTLTLQNVDALDATTEATIEAAIDTLANLTTVQGRTVTLADAGANAIFGWDDTASAYENLTAAEATAVINAFVGDAGSGGTKGLVPAPAIGDATKFLRGDATFVTIPGGGDALTSSPLSQFAATTSLQLKNTISDETGSGALVFADAPQMATIELGHATDTTLARASAGVLAVEGVNVVTVSSTDTLTNKTLTSPVLTTPQINDTSADHQYVFAVSELAADRTVTLPLLTGNDEFVFKDHTQTLTNKTVNLTSNTLSGTKAQFDTACSDEDFAYVGTANTFTAAQTATSFIPSSSTIPTNGLYLPAANTLGLAINSAAEVQLTDTALSPAADGGSSLGTTALGWQNVFGNTGFVLNIEAGNWVATHTAGILTVGTGDLRVTTAGTNAASAVTVGGTQTLTTKTLTSPTITGPTISGTSAYASGSVLDFNSGDVTVTHSADTLTVTGGNLSLGTTASLTTGTIELGAASDTTIARTSAGVVTIENSVIKVAGRETICIPAAAMVSGTTAGPAVGTIEVAASLNYLKTLDFDGAGTAKEYAYFQIAMPTSWNELAIKYQVFWTSTATDTDGVVWGLQAVSIADNGTLNGTFGTAVEVTDNAQSTSTELLASAESADVTVDGTPTAGELVLFRFYRDPNNASDGHAEDARLIQLKLFFNTDAKNDA